MNREPSIVNRAEGIGEIEGKAAKIAASEAGAELVSIGVVFGDVTI